MSIPDWEAVRRPIESRSPAFAGFESRQDYLHVEGYGAKRASVRIVMSEDEMDIIYNSPVGLRAQYGLGIGAQRNCELLDASIPPSSIASMALGGITPMRKLAMAT